MANKAGPRIVTNSLTLDIDVAKTSSYSGTGLTAYDLKTSGIGGTLVNGVAYNSSNLGSFSFDGINDFILIPNSYIPSSNEATICIWNYGINATTQSVFSAMRSDNIRILNIHLPWSDNVVYWDAGQSAESYDRINTSTLTSAQWQGWHFWAFTKNASTGVMEIYLDGNLNTSGTLKTRTLEASYESYIGRFQISSPVYHNGRVAQILIYNRALSGQEILQNYNSTKKRYGL